MDGSKDDSVEKLEELLKSIYEKQPVPPVSRSWRERVMKDVMALSSGESYRASIWEGFFPMTTLYRFAGISGLCAVLSMIVFLNAGGGINIELSRLLLTDPLGLMALVLVIP